MTTVIDNIDNIVNSHLYDLNSRPYRIVTIVRSGLMLGKWSVLTRQPVLWDLHTIY